MLAATGQRDHHIAWLKSTGRIDIDRQMYRMPLPAV
jgi:hypothetical protein